MCLSGETRMGRSDEVLKYVVKDDCNSAFILRLRREGDKGEDTDSSSVYISDGGFFEAHRGKCGSVSTSSTSVAASETQYGPSNRRSTILLLTGHVCLKYPKPNEKEEDSVFEFHSTSFPTLLSSRHDKQTCEISDAARRDIEPDQSVYEDKGDGRKDNKAEGDNERDELGCGGDKNRMALLPFMRKKGWSAAYGGSPSQRLIKHCRHSPPYRDGAVSSEGECEMRMHFL